jgi:hypothetical protein
MIRRIFEPKSDKTMDGWRTLHNEELLILYSSPDKVRIIPGI